MCTALSENSTRRTSLNKKKPPCSEGRVFSVRARFTVTTFFFQAVRVTRVAVTGGRNSNHQELGCFLLDVTIKSCGLHQSSKDLTTRCLVSDARLRQAKFLRESSMNTAKQNENCIFSSSTTESTSPDVLQTSQLIWEESHNCNTNINFTKRGIRNCNSELDSPTWNVVL